MPASGAAGHNYRVATNPETGEHGYEIGYWPVNADEGTDYVVVARCYDQQEAARLANQLNAGPPPDTHPPDESGETEIEPKQHESRPHTSRHRK